MKAQKQWYRDSLSTAKKWNEGKGVVKEGLPSEGQSAKNCRFTAFYCFTPATGSLAPPVLGHIGLFF